MRPLSLLSPLILCGLLLVGCDTEEVDDGPRTFVVTIANPAGAPTANGAPNVLSPGVWAVHSSTFDFYDAGSAASEGIERIAEDGNPMAMAAALSAAIQSVMSEVSSFAVFDTAVGASMPGPIMPGGSFRFTVTASPGDRLSFATMWAQSNDVFLAFAPDGLALFNGDTPVEGDVTDRVRPLWDAGTEVNEEPGTGPNQAPRQPGPNTGPDENGTIRAVETVGDGYAYPDADEVIRVTISVQ